MFKRLILAFSLFLLVGATTASAQNTLINSGKITQLCRLNKVDWRGCNLLKNSFDVPPVSLIRFLAGTLDQATRNARDPQVARQAGELLTALQDDIGSQQQIKKRLIGGSNAGIVVETAFIAKLEECAVKQCQVLSSNGISAINRSLSLLRNLYGEHARTWDRIEEALNYRQL